MAYIGKTPVIGNFQVCDAITVVDAQAAYTMQVGGVNVSPESANHMLVSLNGILQAPTSSFTVSGSTITFASALETGDVIDFIQILGNVLDLGVPSDNTVTTAKLADSSVSLAKLTATGTKDATTFLRGDNTFAAVSGSSDAFLARGMSGHASGTLIFNSEVYDDGGNYNVANGKYVAPSNGYYIFTTSMIPATASGRQIVFKVNNSFVYGGLDGMTYSDSTSIAATVTMILSLSASDEVTVFVDATVYSNYIYFSGGKLY